MPDMQDEIPSFLGMTNVLGIVNPLAVIEVEILLVPIFIGAKRLQRPEASGAGNSSRLPRSSQRH